MALFIEILLTTGGIAMCEKSVGLVLVTEVPDLGVAAVLRERGFWNFEETDYQSWPGVCQVTVLGKLGPNETFLLALRCETEEELGTRFLNAFWPGHKDLVEVFHEKTEEKEVVIFSAKVDFYMLNLIRLEPSTGSIRFLTQCGLDYVWDFRNFSKKAQIVPDRTMIAMFPDEAEAVKKAFKHFLKIND
ncbi:MAG: hypothetical protein A2601_01835 [Candidatus Staskawiczbacteria bacterium RIFOXYD1_FULL_37_73]|nr:MAG: hypothetical protein A2813_01600 [Candidatus Staskawiczbacteria bacterium RIFCSPHIGHO2_01_FULL_37_17]OGZ71465.1 MAG: hypothetical protein A2891_00955 [Candidatus Staskawiczbacteria bacterium RIFCSPLOWO2_01_FULL_37_19]OGZ76142.1 MAG: hypothetical protein A2205_03780 [Candidatus Staskawiczbacteria bacterium RIFOXYA1_FULL_37_15]OGZ80110.1 MAG: hypothetical protein A2353_02500 [Candidatus Staskawiczbacteria bacterium RIFOXYB1_FULL_38_37]OGZ82871.1 MAG: hypothetical protein A2325_01740 [Cand